MKRLNPSQEIPFDAANDNGCLINAIESYASVVQLVVQSTDIRTLNILLFHANSQANRLISEIDDELGINPVLMSAVVKDLRKDILDLFPAEKSLWARKICRFLGVDTVAQTTDPVTLLTAINRLMGFIQSEIQRTIRNAIDFVLSPLRNQDPESK